MKRATSLPKRLRASLISNLMPRAALCDFTKSETISSITIISATPRSVHAAPQWARSSTLLLARILLLDIRNDQLYHHYLGDPSKCSCCAAMGEVEHIIVGRILLLDSGCSFSFPTIRFIPHVSSAPIAGS